MTAPAFDPRELEIVRRVPALLAGRPDSLIYNFPVTPREAFNGVYTKEPIWQIIGNGVEGKLFTPGVNPDNVARAFVFDGTFIPGVSNKTGGKDMFGIEWEYVLQVGGSMVRPGKPLLEDANEWVDKVVWPDIESWDWEGCQKANEQYLNSDNFITCMFLNGWYERLISFMEFEGAIIAVIDEDQKDAVKDFMEKLSDLYIRILDKYMAYFPNIDCFCMHDDWGSQKDTFFSPETASEMIVPYMKKVTDFLHTKGKYCELHSCGQLLKQVPNIIAAGWDSWNPQAMNDTHQIYELYGDKLLIGVLPEKFDPLLTTEEDQREMAKAYADKFCRPDKPSLWNMYGWEMLTPEFSEELYKQSRINYNRK
ncbi:methyltransferase [Dehalobacter sp. DCM]|uniref:uroporphyrinogen decarboxylase family protein n=1 Tax=Dehalobacter sp. DCM TaxID=2907827 RepID=UPI00308185A6|nr:methyltransferase [Dehalobacter sp. DCM]